MEETGRSVSSDTDDASPVDATRSAPPSKLCDQLPRFGPKCLLFNFKLKRPGFAVVETKARSPGTHRVLGDAPVVSGRVPLPPVLSA